MTPSNDKVLKVETFRPRNERILVLPDPAPEKNEAGLYIPEQSRERPQCGTIVKVGHQVTEYKEGDRVLYGKSAGVRLDFEDGPDPKNTDVILHKAYWLMHKSEIFGQV